MILRKLSGTILAAGIGTALLQLNAGCWTTGTDYVTEWECTGDGGPFPCRDEDAGIDGPGIDPAACQGQCVEMGAADFRKEAVLVWIGEEGKQPECPERAPQVYYAGNGDPHVWLKCHKCECGPSKCALPDGIGVHDQSFCQEATPVQYSAPAEWDGSCVSPSILPGGSFSSIKLAPAKAMPCEPIEPPMPPAPSFAPGPASAGADFYWGSVAKACQGVAKGECPTAGEMCLPSAEPPPPGFRQCVQYLLPVDEDKLPQCPGAFPDRFVFYSGVEGKLECTPCECGDPMGAQCNASFSAYQDTMCSGGPMPIFENVSAGAGTCIDLAGTPYSLASMSAKWKQNFPGKCEPKGGELINEAKGTDPRLFCCQEPAGAPME